MKHNISPELIRKYLNGKCNQAEIEEVQDWYQSFEVNKDPLAELDESERLVLRGMMLSQIRKDIHKTHQQRSTRRIMPLLYAWIAVAASILIVLFWLHHYRENHIKQMEDEMTSARVRANADVNITNSTWHIYKYILSDGSTVWLRPQAHITYARNFGQNDKIVSISGEAFLEVVKDPARSFIIHSGGLTSKVSGTSLRISARKDASEVAVLTGAVYVNLQKSKDKSMILQSNQKAVFLAKNNTLSKESLEKDTTMLMWKKANLSFDQKPLDHVVKTLSNQFGVNIRIAGTDLNSRILNADFKGKSLAQVLEFITKSLGVDYTISKQDVVIFKAQM